MKDEGTGGTGDWVNPLLVVIRKGSMPASLAQLQKVRGNSRGDGRWTRDSMPGGGNKISKYPEEKQHCEPRNEEVQYSDGQAAE